MSRVTILKVTKRKRMLLCPNCLSGKIIKYGKTYYGKQNHQCKDCGRQFVANNQHTITNDERDYARSLLGERISLRGICRVLGVSLTWLMSFVTTVWSQTPEDLGVREDLLAMIDPKQLKLIRLQADEMWSFVGHKKNKKWIWVVYEPTHRQVLAYHIGGRGKGDALKLWEKLPPLMHQHCTFETDYWEAYFATLDADRHVASKAYTYFIEGYFTGIRARCSRLVRKTVSFSKKLENHIAAIGYLFWQRNLAAHPYI